MTLPPFHWYQDDAIDRAINNPGYNLFMRPGLGKTLIGSEVIANTTQGPTLVVGPLRVIRKTWPDEFEKWGYDFEHRLLHGKGLHLDDIRQVNFINYEGLPALAELLKDWRTSRRAFPFKAIQYDEISKMKNVNGRFNRWRLWMPQFDYRLGLTGTPVGNHLLNLWAEMYCVDLGASLGRRKTEFQLRWFYRSTEFEWRPLLTTEQHIFESIAPYAASYDTDLLDMPELVTNRIEIDLPANTRDWYRELSRESTIEDLDMIAANAGVRRIKERQLTGGVIYDDKKNKVQLHGAKTEILKDLVEELQGSPVMVVYEFDHDLENIRKCFNPDDFAVINGSTKGAHCDQIQDDWNAGLIPVLALHACAAHGLNIQGSGSTIIFYTVPWSFELLLQIIQRLWRQGQMSSTVVVHYLEVISTVDTDIIESAAAKGEVDSRLMEFLKAA